MFTLATNDDLGALRADLDLWEEIPRITEVHALGIAITEQTTGVVLCAHDDANGGKHQLLYPTAALDRIEVPSPEQTHARLTNHVRMLLNAAYN